MLKNNYTKLVEKILDRLESLNYAEQFLDECPDFLSRNLPLSSLCLFFLNSKQDQFKPYFGKRQAALKLKPIDWNSHLILYLKNSPETLIIKDQKPATIKLLKKTNPDFFEQMKIDIIIPLYSTKKLYGFTAIEANRQTHKELNHIKPLFRILSNILIPLITCERSQIEGDRNYYRIYRMDRLALVGELAASAAHEIKNPLAGISTFLKYFTELENFNKADIIDELEVMKQSVFRIDEIVKSLLSFSRYKKKKIDKISLTQVIESSLNSVALKIPANIKISQKLDESLMVETDHDRLQQVLINILFNAVEAIDKKSGEIMIRTHTSGGDQLPSRELFHISVKDNGPGVKESFKEKLFQPFQTTKEEGTGLGLYTCYGLMKSLGGSIDLISSRTGTEVTLSLPYSHDDIDET
jgi:signal transduction histidine kinase